MRATRVETLAGSADLGDASRETPAAARLTLAAAALANDATLEHDTDGRRRTTGDPTETALVEAAADVGVDKAELEERSPRTAEVPFDSNRKRMTTLHRIDETDDLWAPLLQGRGSCQASFTKGALDSVLAACDLAWTSDGASSLTDDIRESIRRTHDSMAASGIRVLATAARAWDDKGRLSPEQLEQGLTYLGMIGLMDPPRPEAREAVERCKEAGIRAVMITGDHHATAASIAKSLGVGEGGRLIVGRDLNALSDSQLEAQAEEIGVYARVSPEHKLHIVDALVWNGGELVAMTGDGVNDAPALRRPTSAWRWESPGRTFERSGRHRPARRQLRHDRRGDRGRPADLRQHSQVHQVSVGRQRGRDLGDVAGPAVWAAAAALAAADPVDQSGDRRARPPWRWASNRRSAASCGGRHFGPKKACSPAASVGISSGSAW